MSIPPSPLVMEGPRDELSGAGGDDDGASGQLTRHVGVARLRGCEIELQATTLKLHAAIRRAAAAEAEARDLRLELDRRTTELSEVAAERDARDEAMAKMQSRLERELEKSVGVKSEMLTLQKQLLVLRREMAASVVEATAPRRPRLVASLPTRDGVRGRKRHQRRHALRDRLHSLSRSGSRSSSSSSRSSSFSAPSPRTTLNAAVQTAWSVPREVTTTGTMTTDDVVERKALRQALRDATEPLEGEVAALRDELERVKEGAATSLQSEAVAHRSEVAALKAQLAGVLRAKSDAESALVDGHGRGDEVAAHKARLASALKEKSDAESAMAAAQAAHRDEVASQLMTHRNEVASLKSQLSRAMKEKSDAEVALRVAEAAQREEADSLKVEIEAAAATSRAATLRDSEGVITGLRKELAGAKRRAEVELTALRDAMAAADSRAALEIAALKAELSVVATSADGAGKRDAAASNVAVLRAELTEAKRSRIAAQQSHRAELASVQAIVVQRDEELRLFREELESSHGLGRSDAAALRAELTAMHQRAASAEAAAARLRAELGAARDDATALRRQVAANAEVTTSGDDSPRSDRMRRPAGDDAGQRLRLVKLEVDNADLTSRYDALAEEKAVLAAALQRAQSDAAAARRLQVPSDESFGRAAVEAELAAARDEAASLKRELRVALARLQSSGVTTQSAQELAAVATADAAAARKEASDSRIAAAEETSSLRREVTSLKSELAVSSAARRRAQDDVKDAEGRLVTTQKRVESEERRRRAVEVRLVSLLAATASVRVVLPTDSDGEASATRGTADTIGSKCDEQFDALSGAFDALRSAKENAEASLARCRAREEEAKQNAAVLTRQLEAAMSEIESLRVSRAVSEEAIRRSQAAAERLRAHVKELKVEINVRKLLAIQGSLPSPPRAVFGEGDGRGSKRAVLLNRSTGGVFVEDDTASSEDNVRLDAPVAASKVRSRVSAVRNTDEPRVLDFSGEIITDDTGTGTGTGTKTGTGRQSSSVVSVDVIDMGPAPPHPQTVADDGEEGDVEEGCENGGHGAESDDSGRTSATQESRGGVAGNPDVTRLRHTLASWSVASSPPVVEAQQPSHTL